MIWVYIYACIILAGLAIYFDKKSGASSPESSRIMQRI